MIAHTKRLALIASVAAGLLTLTNAEAEPPAAVIPANLAAVDAASKPPRDGRHDFDFWLGEWQVHHRRIKERLANSHEWIEFEGTTSVRPVMGGAGLVDDNTLALPGNAFRSVGLRAYDPKTGDWSIWWLDTRDPSADLDPAVKGRFENGIGTFYAEEMFKGKPVRTRFTWSHITPTSAKGEQAFSTDGGKTWETNWYMEWTRVK